MVGSFVYRLNLINQRLKDVGCVSIDQNHPISCNPALMKYEASRRHFRPYWVDAVDYAAKLDSYVQQYEKTKGVLEAKVQELQEKQVAPDDVADFVFKEERDGVVYRNTIGTYYETHQIAVNNLVKFAERTVPVDGKKFFEEKNRLVEEKIELLLEMRRLQIERFDA